MCLAASALTQTDYPKIADATGYAKERLADDQYKRLAYIRKRNLEAYGYLVEATRMLNIMRPFISCSIPGCASRSSAG